MGGRGGEFVFCEIVKRKKKTVKTQLRSLCIIFVLGVYKLFHNFVNCKGFLIVF